jgi:Tol biopolymer transport system component
MIRCCDTYRTKERPIALPRKTGFRRAEATPVQLTSSPMPLGCPIPSTDGKKLFVVGLTNRGELSRYDWKTGRFSKFLGGISAEYVALSGDGQKVAYVMLPRWSPDNKTIVFYALSTNQPARIYEVSDHSTSPRPLLPNDATHQADPN